MKAIISAISLVALLGALVILPGCGGGDEAVPPGGTGDVMTPMPGDDLGAPGSYDADPGYGDAMDGPAVVDPIDPADEVVVDPATP